MTTQAEHFEQARFALKHAGPLTPAELDEFNRLRAREMRRAEARREQSPQLDLPEAA